VKKLAYLVATFVVLQCLGFSQQPSADAKKELASLAKLEKARNTAKGDFVKHPKAPGTKAKFIKLNDEFANQMMTTESLTPHQRYPKALSLYRESLKTDPHDAEAKKWVDEIESIYKSMHKPIPH
jgi:hypothetical protein